MSDAETIEPDNEVRTNEADDARQALEAEARKQGWRPKDEFRGNGTWVDAEEFLERGKQFSSILRRENRELTAQVEELTKRQRESAEVFKQFREHQKKTEERAYARAKRELEAAQEVAVAAGDTGGFNKAKASLEELEASRREGDEPQQQRQQADPPPAPPPPQPDPLISRWIDDNPWFKSDPHAMRFAQSIEQELMQDRPEMGVRERLAEVRRQTAKRFPEHFGNPRRDSAGSVSQPAGGGGRQPKKEKGYDDLPADAKKACDRFVKQGLMSKEDYVKSYAWE